MNRQEPEHIGIQLRRWRLGEGLTLEDVAKRLGISFQYVGQIERGVRLVYTVPDNDLVRKIAALIGIEPPPDPQVRIAELEAEVARLRAAMPDPPATPPAFQWQRYKREDEEWARLDVEGMAATLIVRSSYDGTFNARYEDREGYDMIVRRGFPSMEAAIEGAVAMMGELFMGALAAVRTAGVGEIEIIE